MNPAPRLQVVVASTRPGRVGPHVARWFAERAAGAGCFEIEVVDLAEADLPLNNEPHHPRERRYVHAHTRRWSATVERADAFALVVPEYNHGFNAALKNALDYLYEEWRDKPVGIVSYGGLSGGTRAAQLLKPVLVALRTIPVADVLAIPFIASRITEDGGFDADAVLEASADAMLGELARLTRLVRRPSEAVEQLSISN